MDFNPQTELALRWIACNMRQTNGNAAFSMDGKELLIDIALRHGPRLKYYREIENIAVFDGTSDPIDWIAGLLCHPFDRLFVSAGISTAALMTSLYMGDFGYAFRNGFDLSSLQRDGFWESAIVQRDQVKAADHLKRFFVRQNGPMLTSKKIRELAALGSELVDNADHVPFGSLAHAIGRKLDRSITLWSFDHASMRSNESGPGAIRYHINGPDGLQEIILYAPSSNGPSTLDFATRYAVAHELAHVVLGHAPRKGPALPEEEAEAHCLATIFLKLHGAPKDREIPSEEILVPILKSTDLPEDDRRMLLAHLAEVDFIPPLGFTTSVQDEVSMVSDHDDRERISKDIERFYSDSSFRQEVEASLFGS